MLCCPCHHPQLGLADPALTKQQIKSHQAVVEERRAQLQGLRQQRFAVEESRGAAAAALRQAEAVLRDAHHTRVTQRQQLLEQQAMQASVCPFHHADGLWRLQQRLS